MSSDNSAFLLLSINHENVPLEEREAYSLTDDKLIELYARLRESQEIAETIGPGPDPRPMPRGLVHARSAGSKARKPSNVNIRFIAG